MINLHSVVRSAISSIHPDEQVTLWQSIGQVNRRGRIVPKYAGPQAVGAQVQSLGQNDLQQTEQVSTTRIDRKAYLYAPAPSLPPQGIIRPLARNGDMILRADGTWWLVTAMMEDFTACGWVCVGITQQVDGPDLSASLPPADKEEPGKSDDGQGGEDEDKPGYTVGGGDNGGE